MLLLCCIGLSFALKLDKKTLYYIVVYLCFDCAELNMKKVMGRDDKGYVDIGSWDIVLLRANLLYRY